MKLFFKIVNWFKNIEKESKKMEDEFTRIEEDLMKERSKQHKIEHVKMQNKKSVYETVLEYHDDLTSWKAIKKGT
jgi:hypothetical protein